MGMTVYCDIKVTMLQNWIENYLNLTEEKKV